MSEAPKVDATIHEVLDYLKKKVAHLLSVVGDEKNPEDEASTSEEATNSDENSNPSS